MFALFQKAYNSHVKKYLDLPEEIQMFALHFNKPSSTKRWLLPVFCFVRSEIKSAIIRF